MRDVMWHRHGAYHIVGVNTSRTSPVRFVELTIGKFR